MDNKKIIGQQEIDESLDKMTRDILGTKSADNLAVVGIKTRGEHLARRLTQKIKEITGVNVPLGAIDITLYRDDFRSKKDWPVLKKTEIDFNIEGMDILLVDDVIYTGRTARAAIGALMDYGRPSSVKLAVLVDRGHRELPIQPDFTGVIVDTSKNELVKVQLYECDETEEITIG